jgi:hypothetical protein
MVLATNARISNRIVIRTNLNMRQREVPRVLPRVLPRGLDKGAAMLIALLNWFFVDLI